MPVITVTSLVSLLVLLVVLGLVYWAAHRIAGAFGLPSPILAVVDVLLVCAAVLGLLRWSGLL